MLRLAVSLRTLTKPSWSREAFWLEVWFSSCLLQTRVTKTPGNGDQRLASTIGRQAAREDGFWLFARTPVEWSTLDPRKVMTRCYRVFRTYNAAEAWSDSSPGDHTLFGVTYLACRPRDAVAQGWPPRLRGRHVRVAPVPPVGLRSRGSWNPCIARVSFRVHPFFLVRSGL